MKTLLSTRKFISVLSIVLLAILSNTVSFSQTSCTTCSTSQCSAVSFAAVYQGSAIYSNTSIPWVKGMNVTVAMSSANSGSALTVKTSQYCPYGSFVNAINGYAAPSGYYWALYVNGTLASYGVDFQQLNAGDNVVFVCTSYQKIKDGTALKGKTTEKYSPSSQMSKSHQFLFFTYKEGLRKK